MTEISLLLYLIGGVWFTFLSPRSCWSTDGYRPRQSSARLAATITLWPMVLAFPKLIFGT